MFINIVKCVTAWGDYLFDRIINLFNSKLIYIFKWIYKIHLFFYESTKIYNRKWKNMYSD